MAERNLKGQSIDQKHPTRNHQNPLLGTWELISWFNEHADGTRSYPLGPQATDYISYSADGFVFVHLSAPDRALFASNDPFAATAAQDSQAMKSQISYAGTFDYQGARVIHHVTQVSCPNWVGTRQLRDIRFERDTLILSAAGARFQGHEVTAFVHWKRATPA